MRIYNAGFGALIFVLATSGVVGLLAACSSSEPPTVTASLAKRDAAKANLAYPRPHSFFNPIAKGKPLIFVSETSRSIVDIFLQGQGNPKVGQITGNIYGPSGLATDSAGNVYIANNGSDSVIVFAPPYTKLPKLTLDDSGYNPGDVAVSKRGLVAVANYINPTVNFYRKNSTKPCATVSDPSFGSVAHDSFDDAGNLYVDGENGSGFVVGEIQGGCNATAIQRLTTNNAIGEFPGAIKVDNHDRIAIEDTYGQAIYTYNPPVNGSLGSPVTTTPLTGASGGYNFAFRASGKSVYIADYLNGAVEQYAYPGGGSSMGSISVGDTQGVAATPPLDP